MLLLYHVFSASVLYFFTAIVPSISQETADQNDKIKNFENHSQNSEQNTELKLLKHHAGLPNSSDNIKLTSTTSIPVTTWTLNVTTENTTTTGTTLQTTTEAPTFHPITAPSGQNNTCQFLLEIYGKFSSNFTECAIVHAKPFLFCENCVREYVKVVNTYKVIEKHKCKDELLSSDRVMIVNQLHHFVIKLWQDGNCDTCFDDVNTCQANQTCSLSPVIRHFMDSYQDTMDCFSQYKPPGQNGHNALLRDVCGNCSQSYQTLNEKYKDTGSLDEICMDVVELMNHTRIKWSSEFKCIQFKKDVGSVLALGCFIGILPVFFYLGVRVHAVKQKRRVMRQKRLSCSPSSAQQQVNIQYSSSS